MRPPMGGGMPHGREGGPSFGSGSRGHHPPRRERSLAEMSVTVWLTKENATFFRKNGLLWLRMGETETRVSLRRTFPFGLLWELISVLNEEEEEVGIIRDVQVFDEEEAQLLREELARRYYSPLIERIISVKERYGFSYWKVQTAQGEMKFTLHDTYRSIVHISASRVIFLDVDGNRFEIPDLQALDRKSYRKIELYL